MLQAIKNIFNADKKEFRKLESIIADIHEEHDKIKSLTDEELKDKTNVFRTRLKNGETLLDLLPEAFAVVKEASTRILGLAHYDVQLLGGIILHQGNVSEMKTGEGKTLVATLPAYLNALEGKGVHIATANDYLAERDAEWMRPVYEFLGLTVGIIKTDSQFEERESAYLADVTYGTAIEFGFDFLRSNLAKEKDDIMQRPLHFVIVDEADSILIDEAKTPITIAGVAPQDPTEYVQAHEISESLEKGPHYEVDLKTEQVSLTDEGINRVEEITQIENLYDPKHVSLLIKIQNALSVKEFAQKDKKYVVEDGEIILIDALTGRLVKGRKMPSGLQQAVEVKEGLTPSPELAVKALMTYQNFFRSYPKVAGMTGTAKTEEMELAKVFGLTVFEIPTHKENIRKDLPDVCFKTEEVKNKFIIQDIEQRHEKGQPVLVGTDSIDTSMLLSQRLSEKGIPHEVLHAKNHEQEAEIIANAGNQKAVTIVSNMAGRGTDIKLGDGVAALGGLHVIGTTRHESRRIDNQLRGRAGRQGDPGSSQFFVSLEDEIIKKFGGKTVKGVLDRIKIPEDMPIEHNLVTKLIQQVQMSCEDSNFKIREFLLSMDDVLENQRKIIYDNRNNVLHSNVEEFKESIFEIYKNVASDEVQSHCHSDLTEEWELDALVESVNEYMFEEDHFTLSDFEGVLTQDMDLDEGKETLTEIISTRFASIYNRKEGFVSAEVLAEVIRPMVLNIVDTNWMEFLSFLGYLQTNLKFKSMAGGNVLLNYSLESFEMFKELNKEIQSMIVINTLRLELRLQS